MNSVLPKNSLKVKIKRQKLINICVELVRKIPNYGDLIQDKELLLYLLNVLDIELNASKYPSISTVDIIKEVFKGIFGQITAEQLATVESDICFLVENDLVKTSRFQKIKNSFSNLFKKKD